MTKASEPAPAGKYGERIARGAAFLDERAPGWRQRIDLEKLELSSCVACVLGQVSANADPYGWREVRLGFGLDFESAEDHGFALSDDEYETVMEAIESADDMDVYDELTSEWRQYIEATR